MDLRNDKRYKKTGRNTSFERVCIFQNLTSTQKVFQTAILLRRGDIDVKDEMKKRQAVK